MLLVEFNYEISLVHSNSVELQRNELCGQESVNRCGYNSVETMNPSFLIT